MLAVLLLALLPGLADASPQSLYQQREKYREALDDLTAGRIEEFEAARAALADYVLAPYLDYYRVKTHLASQSDAQMAAFQARHGDLPAAEILHYRWLRHLGARHQWQRLLANFDGSTDPELRCYHLRALLATGEREQALAGVADLWTVARSQPKACDPIFDVWIDAGYLTEERAWTRLELALDAGQRRLGRYLLRFFDGPLEPWARAMYDVHASPQRLLQPGAFAADSPYARAVIRHGIERLAARDPKAAARAWDAYRDTHAFSSEEARRLTEVVLLASARDGTFPAQRPTGLSTDFYEGMADAAVRAERWRDVLFYIEQLPADVQDDLDWQYWLARALASTGLGPERAREIYERLAGERHYYGFLAAAQLGRGVSLNRAPREADPEQLRALARVPAMARALELYAVGDMINARREWLALIPHLSQDEQFHAALLAQEAGWIAQGIITANLADLRDNLELRFPLVYTDVFQSISRATSVPEPFLLAVARQESAFDPRARSSANARGLMQLLPPTAELIAGRIGVKAPSISELYDPSMNILLGSHHLASLLNRYDHRRALAAAAYNAGEHRVDRWVREHAGMAMDVWIENIPLRETRDYVKNVLAFTQVYGQLLGEGAPMLEERELALN